MSLALLIRYGTVGILTNLFGYGLYLLLTSRSIPYTVAMTVIYVLGVLLGYIFNKNWTFKDKGRISESFYKYIGVHVIGYSINYTILYVLVKKAGLPHQWVQLLAIGIVATTLVILKTKLVFKKPSKSKTLTIKR